MARFSGNVGFITEDVESRPGVWVENFVERPYFGDFVTNSRQVQDDEKVNNNLNVSNSISIVADAYAREHFLAIRYVRWMGTLWRVPDVRVENDNPRLVLRLGGVYNGTTASAPSTP